MTAATPDHEVGMRSAYEMVHAVHYQNVPRLLPLLEQCDPAATIIALVSAWLSLADFLGGDRETLIESMREHVEARENGTPR